MDILNNLATGFAVALTPINLLYCFLGSFIGTAIGVLPGLGPPATIALLLPVTYGIPATSAVILLAGIFYGAMYGGSTTSILLNIPGEAASVVTCLDGYQMARQGRAGAALAVAAVGSFIAGTIGVVGLMLLAPPLASFALKFGAPENAALLILGLLMVGYLAGASMRSEEHTSELQSRQYLVCRLLLEKKKRKEYISAKKHLHVRRHPITRQRL